MLNLSSFLTLYSRYNLWVRHSLMYLLYCGCFPSVAHGTGKCPEPECSAQCLVTGAWRASANQEPVFRPGDQSEASQGTVAGRWTLPGELIPHRINIWSQGPGSQHQVTIRAADSAVVTRTASSVMLGDPWVSFVLFLCALLFLEFLHYWWLVWMYFQSLDVKYLDIIRI